MAVVQLRSCDMENRGKPCGKEATSAEFGIDGHIYEIDLCDEHREKLAATVGVFKEHARVQRAHNSRKPGTGRAVVTKIGPNPTTIRAWAASNGVEVNQRGRIPQSIVAQFEAANA